jgi:glyoxylase-like metal-dependent hydrolase (beta-lactamase superfamily II)/ferredoxin
MADPKLAVSENVPGPIFVDRTCIDCHTCRRLAPEIFGDGAPTSFVHRQPATDHDLRIAQRATLACPVGAIGDRQRRRNDAAPDFPLRLDGDLRSRGVAYCGFNARSSFGANSYFIAHPDGNWLVDAPRFVSPLVARLEELGGLRYIFLTHRDDVADADRFAGHFGAQRIIHAADRRAVPDAEIVLDGERPIAFASEFTIIPTPGHTEGHCVLLYDRHLFTGDHVSFDRTLQRLVAKRNRCWYSWSQQVASLEKLRAYDFEWILPGHGDRIRQPADLMREQLGLLTVGA